MTIGLSNQEVAGDLREQLVGAVARSHLTRCQVELEGQVVGIPPLRAFWDKGQGETLLLRMPAGAKRGKEKVIQGLELKNDFI